MHGFGWMHEVRRLPETRKARGDLRADQARFPHAAHDDVTSTCLEKIKRGVQRDYFAPLQTLSKSKNRPSFRRENLTEER